MNRMKLQFAAWLLAGAALLLAGCASLSQAGTEADVAAIEEIWQTYCAARVAGDARRWLALWDEGGIQMPPNIPARGIETLNEWIPLVFPAIKVHSMSICCDEIMVAGDWAYSRGSYVSSRTVLGEALEVEGKFLTILKRQADGSWRIYCDSFSSNAPAK